MSLIYSLLNQTGFLNLPVDAYGWLGLFLITGGMVWLLFRWVRLVPPDRITFQDRFQHKLLDLVFGYCTNWSTSSSISPYYFLLIILFSTPLASLLIGIKVPDWGVIPLPNGNLEPTAATLMVFAAVPVVFSAGMFGPFVSAIIGLIAGTAIAFWDTHSVFTIIELTFLAGVFGVASHQRYRTWVFRMLRNPFYLSIVMIGMLVILLFIDNLLLAGGTFLNRLDFMLNNLLGHSAAMGGSLLIAGIIAAGFKAMHPSYWGAQPPWIPSPAENSLRSRFFWDITSVSILLFMLLIVGDWYVAERSAMDMIQNRMEQSAMLISEEIPFFIDTGQSLIIQQSEDHADLYGKPVKLARSLNTGLQVIPFFRVLYGVDLNGNLIASSEGYPESGGSVRFSHEEQSGIEFAINGVALQTYAIPPSEIGKPGEVSFISTVRDNTGELVGVLVGRADLASNPITQPIVAHLENIASMSGTAFLLDEFGRILFQTAPGQPILSGGGGVGEQVFFEQKASDGTRTLVLNQPTTGFPWSIVITVPAGIAQEIALEIAVPLLLMLILLLVLITGLLRYHIGSLTNAIGKLAGESARIAQGKLEDSIAVERIDEIGELQNSFEMMRGSLKSRLTDLNLLLQASQGVASSLEFDEAVKSVLEAGLTMGASSARVVIDASISSTTMNDRDRFRKFGMGPASESLSFLDEQVVDLTRDQDKVVITNVHRMPLLSFGYGAAVPESILAFPLYRQNKHYGALWLAFDYSKQFSHGEIQFASTLATHAAMAAGNSELFLNAEVGRQRLAAMLDSASDPIIVTDHGHKIILTNPAAKVVFGEGEGSLVGKSAANVLRPLDLYQLIEKQSDAKNIHEFTANDGNIYEITVSEMFLEGANVGWVYMLRDITSFKELDTMKTEFVATVSHDLRSPLTLMRGYSTMMQMMGDLNEQQDAYLKKIQTGVSNMMNLVENLLDLGRIEANISLDIETIPVRELVEDTINNLKLEAIRERTTVSSEIADDLVQYIEADKTLLVQVLRNLIENSIKFRKKEGLITVKVSPQDDMVLFEIVDNGIGIAPVDMPRVFDKFYRVGSKDSHKERGTGLGLAIVKSIVERHGGSVGVDSRLGLGSTFYFTIPIHQEQD